MNAYAIGTNIKKLREENQITQQQLADSLGISYQAVSKWECGTTIPDVVLLPQIAEFFNVTIDDLFKTEITVYRNRAERLMCLYEDDINNIDIYEKAEKEFIKLFETEKYNIKDIFNYAYLHELKVRYHSRIAEKNYLKAIELGEKTRDDFYYKIQRQYMYFLSNLSRNNENIERQKKVFENDPNNENNYILLICAYFYAYENKKAYEIALDALKKYPHNALILQFMGDISKRLGKFDDAIGYWNKAFKIDPEMIDAKYSLVFLLTEQGKYEEAIKVWEEIIEWLNVRGYKDFNWQKSEIKKLRDNLK